MSTQTGHEVVDVGPGVSDIILSQRMEVGKVIDFIKYVEEIKSKVMQENEDYGVIPGTKKPSLLQPGAEKLCAAFQLSAKYVVEERAEDIGREWDYQSRVWDDSAKKMVPATKHAIGWVRFMVRCTLTTARGFFVCDAIGECESTERGREESPAHTVLAMAQKRALVRAVKQATFSSSLFTADMEDFAEREAKPASEKQINFVQTLLKRNAVPADAREACQKWLDGDTRTMDEAKAWIDTLQGFAKGNSSRQEKHEDAPASAPAHAEQAEDVAFDRARCIEEINQMESVLTEAGKLDAPEKRRLQCGGKKVVADMSDAGLKNYYEKLLKAVNQQ